MAEEPRTDEQSPEVTKRLDDMIEDVSKGRVGVPGMKKLRDTCDAQIAPKPKGPPIFDAVRKGRETW